MDTNKLLKSMNDLSVEMLAQAQVNLEELAESDKEISVDTLLLALPEAVRNVVNDVAGLRLRALENLVAAARKKHNKKNADLFEIKKDIGVNEVEDEIVTLLPVDINLLTHQASVKLEFIYSFVEAILGFNQEANLSKDDEIILKILSPIERLKSCILIKREEVLKLTVQINEIKSKAKDDIALLKSEDGYESLEVELDFLGDGIGLISDNINLIKQKEQTEEEKKELKTLEELKIELTAQFKTKQRKLSAIDAKFSDQVNAISKDMQAKLAALMKDELESEMKVSDDLRARLHAQVLTVKEDKKKLYEPVLEKIRVECNRYSGFLQESLLKQAANQENSGPSIMKIESLNALLKILDNHQSSYVRYEKCRALYRNNRKNLNVEVDAREKDFFNIVDPVLSPGGGVLVSIQGLFGYVKPVMLSATVPKQASAHSAVPSLNT